MSDELLPEPKCIHDVPWYEWCMECWPEEPGDILPQGDGSHDIGE